MGKTRCPPDLCREIAICRVNPGDVLDVEGILELRWTSATFHCTFCLSHSEDYFRRYGCVCLGDVFLSRLAKKQFGGLIPSSTEARRHCIDGPHCKGESVEVPSVGNLEPELPARVAGLVVVAAYVFLCSSLRLSSRNSGLAAMSAFDNEPLAEGVEEGRSRRAGGTTARDMGRLPSAASILSRSGRVGEICTSVVSEICCRASTERMSRDARLGAKSTRSWARRNASKSANVIWKSRSLLEPVFRTCNYGSC